MRSTFDETVFQPKSVFRKFDVFIVVELFWKMVLGVFEQILMDL